MTAARTKGLAREILFIVLVAAFLGLLYNAYSPRGIRLFRARIMSVAAGDSAIFGVPNAFGDTAADSGGSRPPRSAAPLHERALRNQDSMAALFGAKEEIYRTVSLDQVRRLLEEKKGLFIDARNAGDYKKGHIRRAWSIPALEMERYFDKLMTVPSDTLTVIYCNGPDCHLGRMLADFLKELHFTNLYLYDDGWDGWEKANRPVER